MARDHSLISLASENHAGVHPEILEALAACNAGNEPSYGKDSCSESALQIFRGHFGDQVSVCYTFNGTGANMFALSTMTSRLGAVLCSDSSHLQGSESTCIEMGTGCKVVTLPSSDGRIDPQSLRMYLKEASGFHAARPEVISITQPTEYGTVYSLTELQELCSIARSSGLLVHMDGARLFNAAAFLQCPLQELTKGVDVLSLGGTKAGMMFGEAVIFLNDPVGKESLPLLKRSGQMASKTRFIACQFEAMLRDGLWMRVAARTNAMARQLAEGLLYLPEVRISRPVQTNAVFAVIPHEWTAALLRRSTFHVWEAAVNEVRWVCSFDTTQQTIDRFTDELRTLSPDPDCLNNTGGT